MRSKLTFDTIREKRDINSTESAKNRNFDVLYAFSVCRRCAIIWFGIRSINENVMNSKIYY
jgi:hypothetical protein